VHKHTIRETDTQTGIELYTPANYKCMQTNTWTHVKRQGQGVKTSTSSTSA